MARTFIKVIGAGGLGDLSTIAQFDAEDDDVVGFTNIATSATDPIHGVFSYTVSAFPAAFPLSPVDDRNLDKHVAVSLQAVLTSGTAKFLLKDQAGNVIDEVEFSSTTIKEVTFTGYADSAIVTDLQVHVEDVSSATGLKIDDVIITDDPFVNKGLVATGSISLRTASGFGSTNTVVRRFNTIVTNNPNGLMTYADSATLGASFTIEKDSLVTISYTDQCSAGDNYFGVELNGTTMSFGDGTLCVDSGDGPLSVKAGSSSWSGKLVAGDILRPVTQTAAKMTPTISTGRINISAQANSENIVHHSAGTENTFSASIDNTGSLAVVSESFPFIDSLAVVNAYTTDIFFKPGFFTVAPIANATALFGSYNVITNVLSIDTTKVRVGTTNYLGSGFAADFNLSVHNQGADYKQPNAFGVTSTEQIAIVSEVQPMGTTGATPTTAGSWITCALNTAIGDNITSLSANQFVLGPGKYQVKSLVPWFTNSNTTARYVHTRLRNITDNSTSGTSDLGGARASGSDINNGVLHINTILDLTESKVFEIQKNATSTEVIIGNSTSGTAGSENRVITQVEIRKIR